MTKLLLRLFVKGAQNPDDPAVRLAVGKLAGVVGILCNGLLCLGKVLVGTLSGSVAIVADGVNNLSDAASSVVTLLASAWPSSRRTPTTPMATPRYEYISGLVVAALILVIGADLAQSSVGKILSPEPVGHRPGALRGAHRVHSRQAVDVPLLRRAGVAHPVHHPPGHLGGQPERRHRLRRRPGRVPGGEVRPPHRGRLCWPGGVAAFILWSGWASPGRPSPPPGPGGPTGAWRSSLSALVLSHEKVLGLHDLLVHDYGPGQCFASVHVEMSAQEDPLVCHDIIDDIECQALEELHVPTW